MTSRNKTAAFFSGKVADEYDKRAKQNAPLIEGMYFTMSLALKDLPDDARVLSVGTGTGNEIFYMAEKFPNWHFTCVEPAKEMCEILIAKVKTANLERRIEVFRGFLDEHKTLYDFDCALCLLVSHFILKPKDRISFFKEIAARLKARATLVNADISSDMKSEEFQELLPVWLNMQKLSGLNDDMVKDHILAGMGKTYDVSSNAKIEKILRSAGFERCALLYRSILINAWLSHKT